MLLLLFKAVNLSLVAWLAHWVASAPCCLNLSVECNEPSRRSQRRRAVRSVAPGFQGATAEHAARLPDVDPREQRRLQGFIQQGAYAILCRRRRSGVAGFPNVEGSMGLERAIS